MADKEKLSKASMLYRFALFTSLQLLSQQWQGNSNNIWPATSRGCPTKTTEGIKPRENHLTVDKIALQPSCSALWSQST